MRLRAIQFLVIAFVAAHAASGAPSQLQDEASLIAMHEAGLKAHLDRNIDALLAHQADDFVLLNRGEVSTPSKQERREFLGPYLAATTFEFYRDRIPPKAKVSRDGTLG